MSRSLSITYLLVILTVGYLGGTLLFRELSGEIIEKLLLIYDARIVEGQEANFIWPLLVTIIFFIVAYGLSRYSYSRFLVIFIAAIKAVLFGLASGYLLKSGIKMVEYTIWWFPFQLLICFVFLLYCAILTPPFFLKTTGKKVRNDRALLILATLGIVLLVIESLVFYFVFS